MCAVRAGGHFKLKVARVVQHIKEVSTPAFFMRIASLNDESENDEEKDKLAALASNLVTALEVVVQVAPATDTLTVVVPWCLRNDGHAHLSVYVGGAPRGISRWHVGMAGTADDELDDQMS